MFQQERQDKILQYINAHKNVRTKDLSRIFKASMVTIRADINELDKKGLIVKVHGGALAIADRINLEIPSQSKMRLNSAEKRIIGKLAADMVEENDVILIDSGTTTLEVARALRNKKVTVITNDIQIGALIASDTRGNITLIVTGGTVEANTFTLCGIETLNFLKRIKVNKLFMGCDAIDPQRGVSNRTLIEAGIKREMMAVSEKVIAVLDSSKHNKEVFIHVCDISEIDVLVTDRISAHNRELFGQAGVEIVTPYVEQDNKTV
ncbi:MAG: DeoR/GlpR family DNA-binding transcription regulator [Dysosmobacter sp.]|nr:DeoR/GlpR family DNA-binding transcription regulator [Dysosmobacter sp.]